MLSKKREKEVREAIEKYKTADNLEEAFRKGEISWLTLVIATRRLKKSEG